MPPEEGASQTVSTQPVQVEQGAQPTAPVENQASTVTEVAPSASQPTPSVPPSPPTLNDVLAARKEQRAGKIGLAQGIPEAPASVAENAPKTPEGTNTPEAPQTPQETQASPQPVDVLDQAQRDQFWEYAKTDPAKAVELLQKLQPEPGTTQTEQPKLFRAAEHIPQWKQLADQAFQARPRITLSGLLGGEEHLESLDLRDADMTDDMTAFVQAAIAPQISMLLSEFIAPLREQMESLGHSVSPVLSSRQEEAMAKDGGAAIREAFPSIVGNQTAIEHFNKTFDEFASALYPKELIENPQSNPQEYARMLRGIATLAAKSWVAESPAPQPQQQTQTQQTAQPQAMSPAPQRIVPENRNHLGQFAPQNPVSLEDANALRAQKLLARAAQGG